MKAILSVLGQECRRVQRERSRERPGVRAAGAARPRDLTTLLHDRRRGRLPHVLQAAAELQGLRTLHSRRVRLCLQLLLPDPRTGRLPRPAAAAGQASHRSTSRPRSEND